MTITIEAAILARAMRSAAKIVQSTQILPILANVRLVAEGDGYLVVTTSDLDTEFRQRLPLVGKKKDAIATTVDAKRLSSIAAACDPGAQLSIEEADGRAVVKAGRSRWLLPTLPAKDFPPMPTDDLCEAIVMPAKVLSASVARVLWAAADNLGKPWYMGVALNPDQGKLALAGSDGTTFIALTTDTTWPEVAETVIVPSKYASTLKDLCADLDTSAIMAWDKAKIRAQFGDVVLTGKLLDYQYPEYRALVTKLEADTAETLPVIADPATLRTALGRVELVASGKTRSVRVDFRQDLIEIGLTSAEGCGEASEEVPADCAPTEHPTRFHAQQIGRMLEHIGGDTIEIRQANNGSPALIRRKVPDGAVGVVMPMLGAGG